MVLENKLGITESAELAREEEKLSVLLRHWLLSIIISLAIFMNLLERFVRRT